MYLTGKRILVTGGTGSLGTVLVKRMIAGMYGVPERVTVFSRDESKQHDMRVWYKGQQCTDEVMYRNYEHALQFQIGDIRNYHSVLGALRDVDIVFNVAALKHVPTCEYFPYEAVRTNVGGPEQIVRAILENELPVETVVGISTDKACEPVNVMGMTKAIQERVFMNANLHSDTRFFCVRYGNVIGSRGSVIPLFREQIERGGPVTITHDHMTRFLLTIDDAADTVFDALALANRGETIVPRIGSSLVMDVAKVLMRDRPVPITVTGIRPGEKIHEVLVSHDEADRTMMLDGYFAILPILPELRVRESGTACKEFCSANEVMPIEELREKLNGA